MPKSENTFISLLTLFRINAILIVRKVIKMENKKALLENLKNHLNGGGRVLISTYTKATIYDKRHIDYFSATDNDILVRHGKHLVSAKYASIKFTE